MTQDGPKAAGSPQGGTGNVSIGGDMSGGAINTGAHGSAADNRQWGTAPVADQAYEELLGAVRELRSHLPLLVRSPEVDELEGELTDVEDEITSTGRTGHSRLERLRGLVQGGVSAVSGLASALAVAQAVSDLVG
ncbi:hypothetical protein ACWEQN_39600 [Streptomyces sp. NPDC004129]